MSNQRYLPEFNDQAIREVTERGYMAWPRMLAWRGYKHSRWLPRHA